MNFKAAGLAIKRFWPKMLYGAAAILGIGAVVFVAVALVFTAIVAIGWLLSALFGPGVALAIFSTVIAGVYAWWLIGEPLVAEYKKAKRDVERGDA